MRKDSSRNETRISSRLVEYPDRVVDSFQDGIGQSIPSITMKPRKKKCFLDRDRAFNLDMCKINTTTI